MTAVIASVDLAFEREQGRPGSDLKSDPHGASIRVVRHKGFWCSHGPPVHTLEPSHLRFDAHHFLPTALLGHVEQTAANCGRSE